MNTARNILRTYAAALCICITAGLISGCASGPAQTDPEDQADFQEERRELNDTMEVGGVEVTVESITRTDDGFELEYSYANPNGSMVFLGPPETADHRPIHTEQMPSEPGAGRTRVRASIPSDELSDGHMLINFGYFNVSGSEIIGSIEVPITEDVVVNAQANPITQESIENASRIPVTLHRDGPPAAYSLLFVAIYDRPVSTSSFYIILEPDDEFGKTTALGVGGGGSVTTVVDNLGNVYEVEAVSAGTGPIGSGPQREIQNQSVIVKGVPDREAESLTITFSGGSEPVGPFEYELIWE